MSCAPDPRNALHAQVTGRAPVTGRGVIYRGRFEGSAVACTLVTKTADKARTEFSYSDELITTRPTRT